MRIDRLVIRRYGPLQPRTIEFTRGFEGLHVVFGGNEWGKSLSLQALEHALFSVPRKIAGFSDQDMLQLDLELSISRRAGSETTGLAFRRRRQSLTTAGGGEPIDDRQIAAYLGGITEDTFKQMYGLTAERIREGGRLIQNAKGDIGVMLFAAATGLERVRNVGRTIEARQGALYSPAAQATNPRLNAALRALQQSFSVYSKSLRLPDAVARLEIQLGDTADSLAACESCLAGFSAETTRLHRVRGAHAAACELHAARQRLTNLGRVVFLAETFRGRLDGARQAIGNASLLEAQLGKILTGQRNHFDSLAVDERVLAVADVIDSLVRSTGELDGLDKDLPRRHDELGRHAEVNVGLLGSIVATTGRTPRGSAAQNPRVLEQIGRLIETHGGIVTACDERDRQLQKARGSLREREDELAAIEPLGNDRELREQVAVVRDRGDIETQLAAKLDLLVASEEDYQVACQRLERRQTVIPVEDLPVPSLAEVREHGNRWRSLETAGRDIDVAEEKANELIVERESRISLLEQEADLPGEDDLERIRDERDFAIQAARNVLSTGRLAPAEVDAQVGAIERMVKEADQVSDRLLIHADRASQRRQHRNTIDHEQQRLARLRERRAELETNIALAQRDWAGLWRSADVTPKSPGVMEEWLATHAECRKRADAVRDLRRDVAVLKHQDATDRAILTGVIEAVGRGAAPAVATRKRLLDRVTEELEDRDVRTRARKNKALEVENKTRELKGLEEGLNDATRNQESWRKQWADCMALLDQPDDVSTTDGRFLVDTMRQIAANETDIVAIRDRIDKMEQRRAAIHAIMRQVCDAIQRPFDPADVQGVGRSASDLLRSSRDSERNRRNLDRDITKTEKDLDDVQRDRISAEAVFAALRLEGDVDSNDSLDEAWRRSERARELQLDVDRWEQNFLRESGTVDAETLLAECLASSTAEIDEKLEGIERESLGIRGERDKFRDKRKELQDKFDSFGGEEATRAWADCRLHEADALERVSDYLPLRLAAHALSKACRRYRDEHHAPVLGRAGELFGRITRGRYSRIELAENDIYALRADSSTESVLQRYMSEGTRDQLYLALRVAALEQSHRQGAEPLPLILDDGLVHFDDDRTGAMMEVLADVSAGMQVILFTHHGSVMQAARTLNMRKPGAVILHGEPVG